MNSFLTSKIGFIDKLTIFSYSFTDIVIKDRERFYRLKKRLKKFKEVELYEITDRNFSAFKFIGNSNQYFFNKSIELTPPFYNTQEISSYISCSIRATLSQLYCRYLNENTFITNEIEYYPFILKKCIQFNVEVFESGKLLVHFLPTSKITSPNDISLAYLNELNNNFTKKCDDIEVCLNEQDRFKRLKFDLFSKEGLKNAKSFFENNKNIICSFNYHFIKNYSSEIFKKITEETNKDIDKSIYYLQEKLSNIEFNNQFNFQNKPFQKISHLSLGKEKNLIIGDNFHVNQQAAAYYNGMYKPANNAIIQPVLVNGYDDFDYDQFLDLFSKFNKNGNSIEILAPISVKTTDEKRFLKIIDDKKKRIGYKFLLAIFTKYEQSYDFTKPLRIEKIIYQTYLGKRDTYKLSNYIVKCIEKLGGHLCILNNSHVDEDTYFVGIDLGHSKNINERFSNLAVVFFDNKGVLLHSIVNEYLEMNEAITKESLEPCFTSFGNFLEKHNKLLPRKLIIHRDGKLHKDDILNIVDLAKKQLLAEEIDIVEIIKHGFPVIACFDEGAYLNLDSGDCFLEDKYAILITNIQADEKNAVVNPIIIKHKYGNTEMKKIVHQVYWFTKVYTNNLYNSTRLPATTLKANNIAGTSLKKYQATYKG